MHTLREAGALDVHTQLSHFLRTLARDERQLVLCAHNGKGFDTRILRSEMTRCDCVLPKNVIGFADSMLWIRWDLKIVPTNLDTLMVCVLAKRPRDEAHGALSDVCILKEVVLKLQETHGDVATLGFFETSDAWKVRTHTLGLIGTHDLLPTEARMLDTPSTTPHTAE